MPLAMNTTEVNAPYAAEGGGKRVDPLIWLIPLVLSCLGILMVTSTTSPSSFEAVGTPFAMGFRQLWWLAMGIIAMFVSFCVPSSFWYRMSSLFWIGCVIFVALTLIPGVGTSVGGARRWIRAAGMSIQPAEILTLSIVFHSAKLAVKNELDPAKCFYQYIVLLAVSCAPLIMQPDLGSTILVVMICMGMYVERFGWRRPLCFGVFVALPLALLIFFEPYRIRRVTAFVNPWQDPLDSGFQTIQGLIAFANGGAWGSGLGHGFQKLNYLPAAYTDFIYAALGEELGLIGTLGVMALCLLWVTRGRSLYNRTPEGFETSVVWGVILTIILPFFINIAGVTNLMPLTGMPLPFISYGGSALIMVWMRVGVLLRIQKESSGASE
jgi:cell division protein FtsW